MKATFIFLFFLICFNARGQDTGHSHEAPQKGIIQEAGSYHIEMFKEGGELFFKLVEAANNPLLKIDSGEIEFEFGDNKKIKLPLTEGHGGAFGTEYPKEPEFSYCTVTLKVGSNVITTRYKRPKRFVQKKRAHGH
jgi:hypothetical protein